MRESLLFQKITGRKLVKNGVSSMGKQDINLIDDFGELISEHRLYLITQPVLDMQIILKT